MSASPEKANTTVNPSFESSIDVMDLSATQPLDLAEIRALLAE